MTRIWALRITCHPPFPIPKSTELDEKEDEHCSCNSRQQHDVESMRRVKRITSGASIVIKNVLSFLEM